MKNSESQKFEQSWREAFSDAEANPPDSVWTNIDLQLSRAESGNMRRRVIFYQRLAAASVIFAIVLSGLGIWYSSTNKSELAYSVKDEEHDQQHSPSKDGNNKKDQNTSNLANVTASSGDRQTAVVSGKDNHHAALNKKINESKAGKQSTPYVVNPQGQQAIEPKHDSIPKEMLLAEKDDPKVIRENGQIASGESIQTESKIKDKTVEETSVHPLFIEPLPVKADESKKKTNTDEDWWASLGGSAGSYNPNASTAIPGAPLGSAATANTLQQNTRSNIGTSYSVGMNFGKKIAPRLMLMSGFNFLTQSKEYNSSVAILNGNNSTAYAADLVSLSSAATPSTPTTPYTLNSVNEFISIPFQAGYLFIDRKLGLQLNTGIATDFFIRNTLADQSGKLLRYTQGAGDNSSYRSVNLTGLMGTELSYKVARHYRVSLVPGLRYSFNSVLKSTTGSTINPMVWDVGFRFRYMF